jgi:hypothetical protein
MTYEGSLPCLQEPAIEPVLSQINPVRILPLFFFKMNFNIFSLPTPRSFKLRFLFQVFRLKVSVHFSSGSRDSAVGIVTGYGLDNRGVGVLVPIGKEFSILHVAQAESGAHPASYPMGIEGSFLVVKQPEREADHSPPTNAEVKKSCIYTSTPP